MTFDDVLKFNPYHDSRGRFASANSATSFTYSPGKSKAHDNAIQRARDSGTASKGFKGTLYHGSPATDIEEFDMNRAGANTSSGEKLIFFTDSKQMAEDFSYERLDGSSKFTQQRGKKGRVYEVEVEMKNPLDLRNLSDKDIDNILQLDADGLLTRDLVQTLSANHQLLKASLDLKAEKLKQLGYDGLIANTGNAGHNSLEYAVVDSKQAKIKKSVSNMSNTIAKTFDEVLKFNPYHDSRGRFATANGAMSFTHRTKDPNKQHWADMAIEREKQRTGGGASTVKPLVEYPDPDTIAGVKPGEPMTREEADQMKANPNYFKMGGYTTNCQSCVVAYEARRRGYDVITQPNTPGSALDRLSRASHEAWIDPKTGKTPERPTPNKSVNTPKQCRNMLENTIQPGERYTFGHSWKGRSRSGHIICADKDSDGNLRLFDPQNGKTMVGKDIDDYLSRVKYTTTVYGMKINCSPRLLRVDNLSINPAYANDIMSSKEAWRKQYAS